MSQNLIDTLQAQGRSKEEIERALSEEADLRMRFNACLMRLDKIKKEYEEEQKTIADGLSKIREECQHYEVEYYPDPSGNNDSSYVCQLCGKDRRRKSQLGGIWK